jgi:hypothetical protein
MLLHLSISVSSGNISFSLPEYDKYISYNTTFMGVNITIAASVKIINQILERSFYVKYLYEFGSDEINLILSDLGSVGVGAMVVARKIGVAIIHIGKW